MSKPIVIRSSGLSGTATVKSLSKHADIRLSAPVLNCSFAGKGDCRQALSRAGVRIVRANTRKKAELVKTLAALVQSVQSCFRFTVGDILRKRIPGYPALPLLAVNRNLLLVHPSQATGRRKNLRRLLPT